MKVKNNLFVKVIVLELLLLIIYFLFILNKELEYLAIVRVLEHVLLLSYYLYTTKKVNKYIITVIVFTLFPRVYLIYNVDYSMYITALSVINVLLLFYIYKDFSIKNISRIRVYLISVIFVIFSISLYLIFAFSNIGLNLDNIDLVTRIIFSGIILFLIFYLSCINVLDTLGRGNFKFFIAIFICVVLNVSYTLSNCFSFFIIESIYPILYSLVLLLLTISNIEREDYLAINN